MNYRKLDYFLLPFTFLSFIVSLYFLIEDQFISTINQTSSIAEVIIKTNTVKTKSNSTLFWINTKFGDYLGNKDQIYAHKNSQASIKLKSGSTINIGPNTLISLDQFNKQDSIKVEKGFIVADFGEKSKSIKLNIGNSVINLKGSNAKIQISKSKGISKVSIIKGEVSLSSNKENQLLKKGQFFSYSKSTEKVAVESYKIKLIEPIQSHIQYLKSPNENIHFKWNSSLKSTLQVSKTPTFSNLIINQDVKKNSSKLSLVPGTYYWRIKNKEGESIVRSFKIIPTLSTTLDSPNSEDFFFLESKPISISFSWIDPFHDSFLLEINHNGAIKKFKTNKTILTIQFKKPGAYSWKVKPLNSKESTWSKERNFTLSPPYLPSPPKLTAPINRERIVLFKDVKNEFRWSATEKTEFEFQFSRDKNFQDILKSIKTSENYLLLRPKEEGKYYWRVRPIDRLARNTAFSRAFEVNFSFYKDSNFIPKNGSKIILNKPNEIVDFKWKKESKLNNLRPVYLFELSNDPSFSNIIVEKKLKSNFANITFPKLGTYYWRTKIQYKGQKTFFGKPQKVTIFPTAPPIKPILEKEQNLEIKVNQFIKAIKSFFTKTLNIIFPSVHAAEAKTSVQINWNETKNTKFYLLEIYSDESLTNLTIKEKLSTNTYLFQNVKEGSYYYRIATIDFWNRVSEFSDPVILNLALPNEFKIVKRTTLKTPKKRKTFLKSRAQVNFSWKKVKNAKKYILRVSKDRNFKNIYLKRTIDKNYYKIRLSRGYYYWKVQAINQFDYKSTSNVSTFRIEPPKRVIVSKKTLKRLPSPNKPRSIFYFQYDLLSTSYEQSFSNYKVLASDLVYTSLELGNKHKLKSKKEIHSKIKRFSGTVFDKQSYGLLTIESQYVIPLLKNQFQIGLGINFNNYKSYKRENNLIVAQSNSSLGLPMTLSYIFFGDKRTHLISLNYALGKLKQLRTSYFINFHSIKKNFFSVGAEYEKLSSEIESSELSISNIKGSFRYNMSY